MNEKVTFDTLPSAVMELTKKVDLLISMFSTKIEKREEIPKYMNTETALEYLRKTGLTISKSKLYKLTASNSIPVYKGKRLHDSTLQIIKKGLMMILSPLILSPPIR